MKNLYSPTNYVQCILGNLQYGGDYNAHFFVIADSTLNEYEINMIQDMILSVCRHNLV